MNIYTVRDNLKNTIAGKEELLKKALSAYNDIKSVEKSFGREGMVSHALSASTQYLEVNIDELKRILADVEKCCEQYFQLDDRLRRV